MVCVSIFWALIHNNNFINKEFAINFTDAAQSETNYHLLHLSFLTLLKLNQVVYCQE